MNKRKRKRPMRSVVLPEILGSRSELDHALYEHMEQAYDLFSVTITIGTGNKRHVVNAPTGNDEVSRRLRRYALCLSRFALPNASIAKRAKVADVKPSTVKAAIRAMAQATHRHSFTDDPTVGTLNTNTLVSAVKAVMSGASTNSEPLTTLLSFSGTRAFQEVMSELDKVAKTPEDETFIANLRSYENTLALHYLSVHDIRNYESVNQPTGSYKRRYGLRCYDQLARVLQMYADMAVRRNRARREESDDERRGDPERIERVTHIEPSEKWETLRVAKPELTVSHTGKLGRKVIRGQEGKYPHYIDRLVTDPERRIFRRKTRSLGAVMVLDCSGSMGWSEEDIDRLIKAASGATILCYSHGRYDGTKPNAWVVARRNQRVRVLPEFPGGNGVDGPALRYALKHLRMSSVNPVIWVSDQQVTGKGDVCSAELRAETDALVKRHGILVTEDVESTLRLVRKLQGK